MVLERIRRRGAGRLVLALALTLVAGACGRGGSAREGSAARAHDAGIAPGAVPRVVEPAARAACVAGEPFALAPGGGRVVGAWSVPNGPRASRVRAAAVAPGGGVQLYRVDAATGRGEPAGEVSVPAGATVSTVWRAHGGGLVLAWSLRGALHAGAAPEGGGVATELDFLRVAQPDGYRERGLGPLDDPSDSEALGMTWAPGPGADAPATLCAVRLNTLALGPCFFDLPPSVTDPPGYALARAMGAGPSGALFVHARRPGLLDAAVAIESAGREVDRVGRLGPRGVARMRRVAAVTGPGAGPMMVKPRGEGLVAWVEPDGGLRVQSVDPLGRARGEPSVLPFAEPVLLDAALFEHDEAALAVETRADRDARPPTATLVLLDMAPEHFARAPVGPVRVPLARARLLPLDGGELLLYALEGGAAVRVRCAPGAAP